MKICILSVQANLTVSNRDLEPLPLPCRIRTDHNADNTTAMLSEWTENVQHLYKQIDYKSSEEWLYPTRDPFKEYDERFEHVAKLRQEGLEAARRSGADYLFVSLHSFYKPGSQYDSTQKH